MSKQRSVLLDTGFFIRLLNRQEKLHKNAVDYFRYFIEHDYILKISTIAIAEYCVKGDVFDLPLRNLMIVPFNYAHSVRAGKMIATVIEEKARRGAVFSQRVIVPNDTKMFAQADTEEDIQMYVTADGESKKIFDLLNREPLTFQFIDISTPCSSTFGVLVFE